MNSGYFAAVFAGRENAVEAQPLTHEIVQRLAGAGMVEHAPRHLFDRPCGVARSPRAAAANKSASGMVSQIVGEAARRDVRLPFRIGVSSGRKRNSEDWSIASVTSCAPFTKSVSRRHQASRNASALRIERPPKRLEPELANKSRPAGGGRFAGNQPAEVAAPERGAASFGGGAVGFDQQRRKALRLRLIAEAVDEIFGRKLVPAPVWSPSRSRTVWLNWLCVKPPQSAARSVLPRPAASSSRYFLACAIVGAGELRQLGNPRLQRGFVCAARLDALTAAMGDCGWSVY